MDELYGASNMKLSKTQAKVATELKADLRQIRSLRKSHTITREHFVLEYLEGQKTISLRVNKSGLLCHWRELLLQVVLEWLGEAFETTPLRRNCPILRMKCTTSCYQLPLQAAN